MKRNHNARIIAVTVLLIPLLAANLVQAIPFISLWQDTGPAPGGGRSILGSGSSDVGQLTATTTANTSLPGNFVTLNAGSTATGFTSATVQFTTDNNTLLNNGTIYAPSFDDGDQIPFENTGAAYYSSGILTGNTLLNNGTINGGLGSNNNDSFGGFIILDAGAGFYGFNGVVNATVNNTGNIFGGSGDGSGEVENNAVSVGDGVIIFDRNGAGDNINGVNFTNSGKVIAGSNSRLAISVDNGFSVVGFGDVKNIVINNTATGVIAGGSTGSDSEFSANGFFTGNGVVVAAGVPPFFINGSDPGIGNYNLNTVNFSNAGKITGGNNNVNTDNVFNAYGNAAGSGVVFWGVNGVYNITFNNSGTIIGGNDGDGNGPSEGSTFGSVVSTGVGIFDASGFLFNRTDIIGVNAVNSGVITGGNHGQSAAMVSTGYGIAGYGSVKNITFTNTATGVITGGNNSDGGGQASSFAGVGLGMSAGFSTFGTEGNYVLDNVNITNNGRIVGGNSNFDAEAAGTGVALLGFNGVTNVALTNNGIIQGGDNNNSFGGFLGAGVLVYDASGFNDKQIQNISIINNGLIAGGSNNSNGHGIDIEGNGDVSDVFIHNLGTVRGGNAGAETNGGDAVRISAEGSSSNIVIANCGFLNGGDAASGGGAAGMGINASASGVTVYNWNKISGGKNSDGSFQTAILVNGSNNTINLNGHSSVYGKITGEGGTNNVLNLNFTGMSPSDIAALKANLNAQGALDGNAHNFTFTVRGVTYTVDPLIAKVNVTSYEQQGVTPNQKALGASLDSIKTNPTGDLLYLYNAIDGGCGARNPTSQALDSLSPISYSIFGTEAVSVMNFLTLEIDTRLNNLRDGSESIDTTGLGGDNYTVASLVADDSKDGKGGDKNSTPFVPEAKQKRWGFFGSGNVVYGRESAHDDVTSSKFTNSGLIMGVDGRINDNLVAGLLFNYSYTTASTDSFGSTATTDTIGGGLYSGYRNGGFYGNGLLTYAKNNYDTTRNIVLTNFARTALGKTDSDQYGINIDGGYDHHLNDNLTFGPLAGLQYVNLNVNGFNETGAGAANLAVSSQEVNSLRSRLGFRMDYHRKVSKEVSFAAEGRVAWQHEFLDDSRAITSSFIGGGLTPFSVKTANPERDAALVGVGIDFTFRDRMTIYADIDAQVGQANYYEYSVRGGLKFSF
jgi:outer membrane autotransporter protein